MRQGPNGRRGRGRPHPGSNGGNQGGGQSAHGQGGQRRSAASLRNQSFDSNGPDVRVRGNAWQVYEKYQSLARDATSAGDRVAAENYLQHAEHYYRIIEAINEATAAEQQARGFGSSQQPGYYAPQPAQAMGQPAMGQVDGHAAPQAFAADMPQPSAEQSSGATVTQRPTNPFFTPDEVEEEALQIAPAASAAG